jgi:hypothetical protein
MDLFSNHAVLGAMAGLLLGLIDYVIITMVAVRKMHVQSGDRLERRRISSVLNFARLSSLIVFPAVGYLVGPMIAPAFMGN